MELASPTSLEILSARRNKALKEAEAKTARLHELSDEIRKIDEKLSFATLEMLDAASSDKKWRKLKITI